MGATTLGDTVEKIKEEESVKENPKPLKELKAGLYLNLDETKFILAKLATANELTLLIPSTQ